MRRSPVTLAITVLWLIALAHPASAHSAGGVDATNFKTRLTSVTPQVTGVEVAVIETGNRIQVTNGTTRDLVVLGYQGEPYLRVGPDGAFENRRSPATYLNADRRASTPVPGIADPEAEPDWVKLGDDPVARWHDHRAHWMGEQNPPAVRRDPGRRHTVIPEWVIPMRHGGTTIEASGDLLWIPGPSPWTWVALAALLLAGTVAASRVTMWAPVLAVLLGVLVVGDMLHAFGAGFATVGGTGEKLTATVSGSYLSVVGWFAGLAGTVLLARRRINGLYAAGFAGLFIALNGGVLDVAELSRSQIPFAWGEALARLATAVSLGLGFGLLVAAVLRLRDDSEVASPAAPASATPEQHD